MSPSCFELGFDIKLGELRTAELCNHDCIFYKCIIYNQNKSPINPRKIFDFFIRR